MDCVAAALFGMGILIESLFLGKQVFDWFRNQIDVFRFHSSVSPEYCMHIFYHRIRRKMPPGMAPFSLLLCGKPSADPTSKSAAK